MSLTTLGGDSFWAIRLPSAHRCPTLALERNPSLSAPAISSCCLWGPAGDGDCRVHRALCGAWASGLSVLLARKCGAHLLVLSEKRRYTPDSERLLRTAIEALTERGESRTPGRWGPFSRVRERALPSRPLPSVTSG